MKVAGSNIYIGGPRMEVENSGIYWRSKNEGGGF